MSNVVNYYKYWRRKWQPTPVFLPGEFSPWDLKKLDTTESLTYTNTL